MTRRIPLVLIFSLLLLAVSATTVFSAKKAGENQRYNSISSVMRDYAMPMEYPIMNASAPQDGDNQQASLGVSGRSASPGAELGKTYYDYQTNNRMNRRTMIGRNFDAGLNDILTMVHATWMDLPGPNFGNARTAGYAAYVAAAAGPGYLTEVNITFFPEYCGYFELEVTPDNRAIIVGHWTPTGNSFIYKSTVWYDEVAPGDAGFGVKNVVPAALSDWKNPYPIGSGDENVIWPTVGFQVRPTGETVTHVAGVTYSGGGASHVGYYFRREGHADSALGDGSLSSCFIAGEIDPIVQGWECPWVFDTLHSTSETIEASKQSGKVALFWTANLPEPGCDTCSINDDLGFPRSRFFNDIYYNISDDYGVTWNRRVNVTHFDTLTEDWGPWNDIAGLWVGDAPDEEFHLAWVARPIGRYLDEGGGIPYAARVYHWAESFPGLGFGPRVAMVSQIDIDTCNPGAFNANLSKVTMATCAGNIYISAVDLYDGHNGDPANPDCSQRGYDGGAGILGSVNGEIVLVISDNNGVSFDLPHNLTRSPTPHCDEEGGLVGACDSDHWASLAPYGITTLSGDDFSGVDTVLPRSVPYPDGTGSDWLHIVYISDLDPGFVGFDNSTWTNSPVKHFRIACVDPDQIPVPIYEYTLIDWPNYVKPDSIKDTTLTIVNSGNAILNILVTTEEDTGPPGWLSTSGFPAQIPDGANNIATGTITFDATGITQAKINSAGGHIVVLGRIFFDHDGPSDIDTIEVTLIITDTVLITTWDTISTNVISLAVATNGRYGGGGEGGIEGIRMDYWFDPAECDTFDSIVGFTKVYLYDGSFAVGGPVDIGGSPDTILSNEIFSAGPRQFSSVYSLEGPSLVTDGMLQTWSTGKMTNHDSSLAFHVTYYAPLVTTTYGTQTNKTWHADQQFITKSLKIWSNDGQDHAPLAIGDVIDWDVPADDSGGNQTGSNNKGEVNSALGLIYFIGAEFNVDTVLDDGTIQECQENDTRFSGMAYSYTNYFSSMTNKWTSNESLYGGYAESNARYVYTGWDDVELYFNMSAEGLIPWTHPHADSSKTDLHGVLTYEFDYNLLAGDTLVIYSVLATVLQDLSGPGRIEDLADKGRNFTHYFGCCRGLHGDLNNDNKDATVTDLVFAVDRIFRGGDAAVCAGEADVNADKTVLDISDLVYLVDKIFRGGDAPPSCGTAPS